MNPRVSIIIPVYNGSNYLREAIDSAIGQTYDDVEIIVVNDGSNDGNATRLIAESYGNKIRYFEKENGGTSSALNFGIMKMKGEYFTWLSHDDIYLPKRIESHMKAIEKFGEDSIIHSNCLLWIDSKECYPFYINLSKYKKYYSSASIALMMGMVDGLSLTFHRKYFDKFGTFDENLRTTQDYMKWFEMFKGRHIIHLDNYYVKSRVHSAQQGNYLSTIWAKENEELYKKIAQSISEYEANYVQRDLYSILGMAMMRMENIGCIETVETLENRLKSLSEPFDADEKRKCLRDFLETGGGGVYLYCMGKRGKSLLHGLLLRGIKPEGFLDGDKERLKEIVYGIESTKLSELSYDAHIIVTKDRPIDIIKMLEKKGFNNVWSYDDIAKIVMETPIIFDRLT